MVDAPIGFFFFLPLLACDFCKALAPANSTKGLLIYTYTHVV